MSEQLRQSPNYTDTLFDYYLSKPEDRTRREEYERRGLIPTNNLSLLIVDDPPEELVPGSGIANPFNWRARPYGHLIASLKANHPELWRDAQTKNAARVAIVNDYWRVLHIEGLESEAASQLERAGSQAAWDEAETFTKIIKILGPQLDAMGISPVEVCM